MARKISFEPRELNVIFNPSGSGSSSTKMSLPIGWFKKMGVTEDDREVLVEFVDDSIVIRKNKKVKE